MDVLNVVTRTGHHGSTEGCCLNCRHGCTECYQLNWPPCMYWRLLLELIAMDELKAIYLNWSPWMNWRLLSELVAMGLLKAVTWTGRRGCTECCHLHWSLDELKAVTWAGCYGWTESCYLNWSPLMYWRLLPELVAMSWSLWMNWRLSPQLLNLPPWINWRLLPEVVARYVLKVVSWTGRRGCTESCYLNWSPWCTEDCYLKW